MKNVKTSLLVILLFLSADIFSQYVNIYGGVKPLNFKSTNVKLSYYDESPAPDYFYTDIDLSSSLIYNAGVSVDGFKHQNSIYYDLGANLFIGNKYFGGDVNVSIGYPLYITKKKTITFLPAFSAGYGLSDRDLGTLINTTGYIQVNETKFQNYTNVDVKLRRAYIGLRPGFNMLFDLSKKLQVRLNASYLYSIYTVNQVSFSGTNNSGEATSDSEDFDAPNVDFIVDGSSSKDSPVDIRGFEFRLGFAFSLGKKSSSDKK